jgi:hypothetical protein
LFLCYLTKMSLLRLYCVFILQKKIKRIIAQKEINSQLGKNSSVFFKGTQSSFSFSYEPVI